MCVFVFVYVSVCVCVCSGCRVEFYLKLCISKRADPEKKISRECLNTATSLLLSALLTLTLLFLSCFIYIWVTKSNSSRIVSSILDASQCSVSLVTQSWVHILFHSTSIWPQACWKPLPKGKCYAQSVPGGGRGSAHDKTRSIAVNISKQRPCPK